MDNEYYSIIPINSLIDYTDVDNFSCGENEEEIRINNFLKHEAREFDSQGVTKTFLYYEDKELVGFFSLCTSETPTTKEYRRRNFPRVKSSLQVYPSIELVYFAIEKSRQRSGLGTVMMFAVIEMLYYYVYIYVGFMMLTVNSRKMTKGFYRKLGFSYHKTKSGHDGLLGITITDISKLLGMEE